MDGLTDVQIDNQADREIILDSVRKRETAYKNFSWV